MPRIAVILPCHNEQLAVADTVAAFQRALPGADVIVVDNASSDDTASVAAAAGARVLSELRRGKGNAVRRAFAEVDADVYVLADGDGTYDAEAAPGMVERLWGARLDMVTGLRRHSDARAYRAGHVLGNRLFNTLVFRTFGAGTSDIFSGYRVLSRRFVKSFPAMSEGFEIEAEMTIHALHMRMPVAELDTRYAPRRQGSHSKLRTYRDGAHILGQIVRLLRLYRPRRFFGALGSLLALTSLAIGTPVVITFLEIGLVPRLPSAVLATGVGLLGALFWLVGLMLESTSHLQLEAKRLQYLTMAGPNVLRVQGAAAAEPSSGSVVRTRAGG